MSTTIFEVLRAMLLLLMQILWDVTLCRLVDSYWRFGGAYCLYLRD